MSPATLPKTKSSSPRGTCSRLPRLGFVGVGWIGFSRMEAILRANAGEIAGIVEPAPELAQRALTIAQQARVHTSIEDLLDSGIEGVVIATPSALHAEQSIMALERGIPVFCQKPLARTGAETRQVVEAARQADCLLGVDLSYRHITAAEALKRVITAGEIGNVYAVDLVFHNAYGPDKPWFYDWKLSGGGCVIDLGIHLVDFMLWNLGFPQVIGATGRLFAGGNPIRSRSGTVEDYATARLDLANGATANLACSWNLPAGREAVISATFYGTKGGACFHNVGGSFYDFVAEVFRRTETHNICSGKDTWGGRAAALWAQKLASSSQFDPESEHLIPVAEALDAIYASAGSSLSK